jgi:hypothetical protein
MNCTFSLLSYYRCICNILFIVIFISVIFFSQKCFQLQVTSFMLHTIGQSVSVDDLLNFVESSIKEKVTYRLLLRHI